MVRIAIIVGAKGRGSNMAALARQINQSQTMEVSAIIGPSADAPALALASQMGLRFSVCPYGNDHGAALLAALTESDFVCLAGYLKLLPPEVLLAFPHRVLNIHPALLPKFGGKGMYGMRVHQAVISAAETHSGCTVHYVSEAYDEGTVILQRQCEVEIGETPESLAAKVLDLEHEAFFEALSMVVGANIK